VGKAALLVFLFLACTARVSFGLEIKSDRVTIVYESEDILRTFNRSLRLGGLSYLMKGRKSITIHEEVANKVDVLLDRVQDILEMYPRNLSFKIVILRSASEVQKAYLSRYGAAVDYIAYYSPHEETVYLSLRDINRHILAHELSHVVMKNYFGTSPSAKIHEVLAQYVDKHLED